MSVITQDPKSIADGRQRDRIANYTKFWNKDIATEDATNTENRLGSCTDIVNGYYDGATELYECGWAQSFHFCRFYKGEAPAAALARHEHYLAAQIAVGKNAFDAVYAIEATCHAPSWVYGEIMKVLKPGTFGVYEWCMKDDWEASIPAPAHADLQHEIELDNGIPEMRPIKLAREALKNVGFEIQPEEDLADRPDAVPWYYPLVGDIRKAQTAWDYHNLAGSDDLFSSPLSNAKTISPAMTTA
ncbi:delta-sterol C-methyltransferase [Mycena amicta]|nr:delta-sterol C-methyltransferase [Mycena amicta]